MRIGASQPSRYVFAIGLLCTIGAGLLLRVSFPAADPPAGPTVGIVWHDEGAWVHNARNKVLFGEWVQDRWNPLYIAPVFTYLEYLSFEAFGVGVRQARLVSELAGLGSVVLLALGVRRIGGQAAGLATGALLATNYVYVMYNRAALMEASMVAFMVAGWYCYVRAQTDARWGWLAGTCALLAFFTKAAAAFFVAALAVEAALAIVLSHGRTQTDTDLGHGRPPTGTDLGHGRTPTDSDLSHGRTPTDTDLGHRPTPTDTDIGDGRTPTDTDLGHRPTPTDGGHGRTLTDTDQLMGIDSGAAANSRRAGWATLGGLAAGSAVALAAFVIPNWAEYRFYNWQMSVTRKPGYSFFDFRDRITWFPILHDVLTRMWVVVVLGTSATLGLLARWRRTHPPERMLVLWIALGTAELLVHDVGNERRFLILIPAFVALASLVLGRDRTMVAPEAAAISRARAALALPAVLFAAYVVTGALTRLVFIYEIRPNVRLGAALAVGATAVLYATWPKIPRWLSRGRWSPAAGLAVVLLIVAGDLVQFVQWARGRTYKNYEASIMLGRVLPAGTLVHGKLANGLALENGIRPVFVGREFGNYDDRKSRDDVRYILTYTAPYVGYEGRVIQDVLDAYPQRTTIMTFDVAETGTGHDRAALIDKFGAADSRGLTRKDEAADVPAIRANPRNPRLDRRAKD